MASNEKLIRIILRAEDQMSSTMNRAASSAERMGQTLTRMGAIGTATITAPIVAGFAAATKSAIDFETAFTGVTKTVDDTAAGYEQLRADLIGLATDTDNAVSALENAPIKLMNIAEAAGQLGVSRENIVGFTEVLGELEMSTNIIGEQGARDLAKFAAATDFDLSNIRNLGDTIVDLGNNFATTEKDLISFGKRMAGASQAGFESDEILAYGAAMDELGLTAELAGTNFVKAVDSMAVAAASLEGGTDFTAIAKSLDLTVSEFEKLSDQIVGGGKNIRAFSRAFNDLSFEKQREALQDLGLSIEDVNKVMEDYAKTGDIIASAELASDMGELATAFKATVEMTGEASKNLKTYAEVSGMTAEAFSRMMKNDPSQAMQAFAEGLGDLPLAEQVAALDDLGFKGAEAQRVLRTLASGSDNLARALEISNNAIKGNNALQDEAIKFAKTSQGAINQFRNVLQVAGAEIGQNFLPALKGVLMRLVDLINGFRNLSPGVQQAVIKFALLIATIGPLLMFFGQLFSAVAAIKGAFAGLSIVSGVTTMFSGLATVISGIATAAVAAVPAIGGMVAGFLAMLGPVGAFLAIAAAVTTAIIGIAHVLRNTPIGEWFHRSLAKASDAARSFINSVKEGWQGLIQQAGNTASQIGKLFQIAFKNPAKNIPRIISAIKAEWQALPDWFKILGRSIMFGLTLGMSEIIPKAIGLINDLGNRIADTARNIFKIRSPSKVMMEIGAQVVEGFQQPIEQAGGLTAGVNMRGGNRLALSGARMGGGGFNVNNMTINVPPGTTEEQTRDIMRQIGREIKRKGGSGIR